MPLISISRYEDRLCKEIEICPQCKQIDHIKTLFGWKESENVSFCNNCGYIGDMNITVIWEDVPVIPYHWCYGKISELTESRMPLELTSGHTPVPLIEVPSSTIVTKGTLKRTGNRVMNRNSIEIKIVRRF